VKLPSLISLGIGILYSFLPFMFVHNIQHGTVLINNISIPLVLGAIFYLNFKEYKTSSFLELLKSKSTVLISLVILIGASLSLYNCFYSLVLLVFLLIKEFISARRDKRKVQLLLFFLLLNIFTTLFNIYPHILFRADSFFTYQYNARNFVHTTLYSISIVDFFVPIKNHIFDSFRFFNELYKQNTLIKTFYDISYLGILGIFSFLTSIVYVFKRNGTEDSFSQKLGFLGTILIFLLLMFLRGGFMTTFYLYTDFLVLGSHYRITPWISCISLIAAGILLNEAKINFDKREWKFGALKTICFPIIFIIIVTFSLLDFRGTHPRFTKENAPHTSGEYEKEKAFYLQLSKKIDDNDMILQIPYVCWVETKNILGTWYGNTWSYVLTEKKTRFSWMALREGTACNINSQISSMSDNLPEMLKYAIYYGYTGVMIEKKGVTDRGEELVRQFELQFNLYPLIDSQYIYYDIKKLKEVFSSFVITPTEGNALNKIYAPFPDKVVEEEIVKLAQLFPSPCVKEDGKSILKALKDSGTFQLSDCNEKTLYNKEFFYFADDKITFNPNLKFDNGQINIENTYTGKILGLAIATTLNEGIYQVIVNNNNGNLISKNLFRLQVNIWGDTIASNKDLTFTLENELHGTKLKPIWISLFKKNISDENLKIRSITIRKIQSLPPQPSSYIKNFYKMVEELVEGLRMLKLNIKGGLDVIKE